MQTLSSLFSESLEFTRKRIAAVAVAALIVAAVQIVVGMTMQANVKQAVGGAGIDVGRLQELQQRVESGDEQAVQELQQFLTGANGMAAATAALGTVFSGSFAAFTLLSILVSMAYTFYLLLLALENLPADKTAGRTASLFLPLLGLYVWVFIRSFVWLFPVGFIIVLFTGPRFALAPVIFVREKKGVFASASESWSRTRGRWGKLFGNMLVAAIAAMVISVVLSAVVAILPSPFDSYLTAFVQQVIAAFITVFFVKLALTVLSAGPALVAAPPSAA